MTDMNYAIDIERIRADLKLSEKRMRHTLGVAEAVIEITKRHYPQISSERAEAAGLMHDFTKEYTVEQQYELCFEYGIFLTAEEKKLPKLLHAKTAAAIAREVYHLDDELVSAIYYHTTGKPAMSGFEASLYLADYIEKNRSDPFCTAVREYYRACSFCDNAIEKTLVFSFDTSIRGWLSGGNTINSLTIEARNYYLEVLNAKGH